MSRVEPKENRNEEQRRHAQERGRRQPVDRTPTKAEGDERTVDEALGNQEQKRRS